MEDHDENKAELLEQWFGVKLKLHEEKKMPLRFNEAEVWWCNFGENIGVEINGKNELFTRPVLVFKKLNKYSFMEVPLTSQPHYGSWYVKFGFKGKMNYANLAQAKTLSSKRLYDRMGELTRGDFQRVEHAFQKLYCNF